MTDDFAYGELLARLRQDLQLDALTDLLPGSVHAAVSGQIDATSDLLPGSLLAALGGTPALAAATRAGLGFATGAATLTWAGGVPQPANVTPAHPLGRVPVWVGVTPGVMSDGQGAAVEVSAPASAWTTTQFFLTARITGNYYNPAAGVTCPVTWVVIG